MSLVIGDNYAPKAQLKQEVVENAAASKIQQAWKNRHPITRQLESQTESLAKLPHNQFVRAIVQLPAQALDSPTARKVVEMIRTSRTALANEAVKMVPVFIAVGSSPKYVLKKENELKGFVEHDGIYFTEEAFEQFEALPKQFPATQAELQQIAEVIEGIDMLPWRWTEDGCMPRARLSIDFLRVMGIPKENLNLQYIVNRVNNMAHVAVAIGNPNQEIQLIDPMLGKPLFSFEEWVVSLVQPTVYVPNVQIHPNVAAAAGEQYNPADRAVSLFLSPPDAIGRANRANYSEFEFNPIGPKHRDAFLSYAAKGREIVEHAFIDRLLKPQVDEEFQYNTL